MKTPIKQAILAGAAILFLSTAAYADNSSTVEDINPLYQLQAIIAGIVVGA